MDPVQVFLTLDGCRREGRLENLTQRKKELQKIHQAIQTSVVSILESLLAEDPSRSQESILLECQTTLSVIRDLSNLTSLPHAIELERLPEKGRSDASRVVAHGNVLVLADTNLLLARAIIPMAHAIAAGNAVLLLFNPARLPKTTSLLHRIMKESGIDLEAISVLAPPSSEEYGNVLKSLCACQFEAVVVHTPAELQYIGANVMATTPMVHIVNEVSTISLVVITRNGDLITAAENISEALTVDTKSHQLLVLVDEAILTKFQDALLSKLRAAFERFSVPGRKSNHTGKEDDDLEAFVGMGGQVWELPGGRKAMVGNSDWKSIDNFPPCEGDDHYSISILPTTSMEVPIDVSEALAARNIYSSPRAYIFANGSESRYLCLFMKSRFTFLNHFPLNSLFVDPLLDSTQGMYSKPSPVIVNNSSRTPSHDLQRLWTSIKAQSLKLPQQNEGSRMGFFPQGTLIGLGHLLVLTTGALGLAWWTVTKAYRVMNL